MDALFTDENTGINFDAYEDIPVEATGDNVPDPIATFDDIDLGPALVANVKRCRYTKPTPVQRYSIPIGMAGRDLMACAQTGSGKTAAFCFPIISNILRSGDEPTGRSRKAFPLALVLSPTRELSSQIYDESRKFTYQTGIRSVVVYGGAPVVNQVRGTCARPLEHPEACMHGLCAYQLLCAPLPLVSLVEGVHGMGLRRDLRAYGQCRMRRTVQMGPVAGKLP